MTPARSTQVAAFVALAVLAVAGCGGGGSREEVGLIVGDGWLYALAFVDA